jgi:hypothetical protein
LCSDCAKDLASELGDVAEKMHMSMEQLEQAMIYIFEEV